MKLAVLADIHANRPALEAVAAQIDAWQPDQVVVAGDVVNRGPRPVECWQFIQERQRDENWLVLRGNHEEYVIHQSEPAAPRRGPVADIFQTSYWTYQQLNGDVEALAALPFQLSLKAPDGSPIRAVHASTRGTRDGIFPKTPDEQLRKQIGRPVVPLFCVGHTHWPLVRYLDETLVVNVGAAGLPFDNDPRVSYGQLTWQGGGWQAEIVRIDYDRQQAERDFFTSGFLEEAGPLARLILEELRLARSQLYQWTLDYEAAVLAGELSLAESVERFLAHR